MCDFGYLLLKVEDHFMGSSPGAHVRRLESELGVRGHDVEPSGALAALAADAHVVRAYFSGMCACEWSAEERARVLSLARHLGGACDVVWVKAGFWDIQGDVNDAQSVRPLVARDAPSLTPDALKKDWLVEIAPPADSTQSLREISVAS